MDELDLLSKLREFRPVVIGSPPLDIDVPTSDIDIACSATDFSHFGDPARFHFGKLDGFSCGQIEVREQPATHANFWLLGWEVELFCQACRVEDQWGVRHFAVERRLLDIDPRLKPVILGLKRDGLKTEPAFAQALQLDGDPYEALLDLDTKQDSELAMLVEAARNSGNITLN